MSDYDPDAILADPESHPLHKVYAEINIGIRDRGERWSKCANCGDPYPLVAGSNETVCSDSCADEYSKYLMDPW
jgi:hypothetical protein